MEPRASVSPPPAASGAPAQPLHGVFPAGSSVPSLLRGAKKLPWQPEPLTLGSLFSAHKSVRGRVPKPSWCPQHPRLPFKAFQGGSSGGRCHCADVRPQRPRLAGTSGFGRGAPSLAPCATALTQQRSGSVHVHLPPRCAPLRRADAPGGTPLNSTPPTHHGTTCV